MCSLPGGSQEWSQAARHHAARRMCRPRSKAWARPADLTRHTAHPTPPHPRLHKHHAPKVALQAGDVGVVQEQAIHPVRDAQRRPARRGALPSRLGRRHLQRAQRVGADLEVVLRRGKRGERGSGV